MAADNTAILIERRRLACHEAGHVLAALLLRVPFSGATIRFDGASFLGQTKIDGNPWLDHQNCGGDLLDYLERWTVPYLAGQAAEDEMLGTTSELEAYDRTLVSAYIEAALREPRCRFTGPNAAEAYEKELRQRAIELLRNHRPALDRLAAALIEREDIDYEPLKEIAGLGSMPIGDQH